MNFEIKTGNNLTCDYTKEETGVLIRYRNEEEQSVSLWMGRKALEQALNVICSLDGSETKKKIRSDAVAVQPIAAPQSAPISESGLVSSEMLADEDYEQPIAPVTAVAAKAVDKEEALQRILFDQIKTTMANNKDDKGNYKLSEVNNLLRTWVGKFKFPRANAYPVIRSLLPSYDKERLDNIFF